MDLTLIGFDMVHYLEFKGIRSTNSAVVAESMFQIKNHKYQWKASLAQSLLPLKNSKAYKSL